MPGTRIPTLEEPEENLRHAAERTERIAEAIGTLVELEDYIDTLPGWRGVAMMRIIERWTHHGPDDPFWSALAEFASLHSADSRTGHGFDDGLRDATIHLMIAADRACGDRAEGDGNGPYLKISTMRGIEAAHAAIGVELDRIAATA